jgi:hypothetical protein
VFEHVIVEWQEPPPSHSGRTPWSSWGPVAEELRANPGKWAYLGRYTAGASGSISSGAVHAFRPKGSFQAVSRNYDSQDRSCDVYARYVGDQDG